MIIFCCYYYYLSLLSLCGDAVFAMFSKTLIREIRYRIQCRKSANVW